MQEIYFYTLIALCAATLLRGLVRPVRFFEYPYFMAGIFAVFILPQAVSLRRFPGDAPQDAITAVLLMTCLCVAACLLGYLAPPNLWITRHASTSVRLDRLFHAGVIFIVASYIFGYLLSQVPVDERGGSMWTGRATIYQFFVQLVFPGLAIVLTMALARGGVLPWLFTLAGTWAPVQSIVFGGRREQTALFILTIGLTLFYQKRSVPPRLAIAAILAFAMVAIPATGNYRSAISTGDFDAVREIDLVSNFEEFVSEESILELRNAAMLMDATTALGTYEYGGGYWDQLVFRFVPAQLLGKDFKAGLMIRSSDERLEEELVARGFRMAVGSTITGMGDSFQQFGYFGCLFFAALAVVFRSLWVASLQPTAVFAQLLYIQTATSAMRAVTHQTVDYLPGLLYNVIFLGLAVWYAHDPDAANRARIFAILNSRRSA